MKKLIGLDKTKTAVFISGTGSNLKNLIKFSSKKNSPITIKIVVSNKKNVNGLKYADRKKIELAIIGGENEFNENKLVIKKLTSSKENDQIVINRNDLINEIKKLI